MEDQISDIKDEIQLIFKDGYISGNLFIEHKDVSEKIDNGENNFRPMIQLSFKQEISVIAITQVIADLVPEQTIFSEDRYLTSKDKLSNSFVIPKKYLGNLYNKHSIYSFLKD